MSKRKEKPAEVAGELVTVSDIDFAEPENDILINTDKAEFQLAPGELAQALGPTAAKKLLADDGLPNGCIVSKEEREQAWKDKPPREVTTWNTKMNPKEMTPEAAAILSEQTETKKKKSQARISKMKTKADTPDPKTHTWDARNNRWVKKADGAPAEPKAAAQKRTASQAAANLKAAKAASKRGTERAEQIKKATPAKTTTAKTKAPAKETSTEGHSEIAIACGVKSTNRRSVLDYLVKHLNKMRPAADVVEAVYGKGEGSEGSLNMVMKGLQVDFDRKKPKYEIRKEKTEKGVTYGLYEK